MILDNFYTSLVFLPHQGVDWLCHANGTEVTPLAPAPGTVEAIRRFSFDRTEFGFMDQQGKRLGHYRILEQAPWIEAHNSITTLPRRCLGHDFVVHDGQMIVGGQGPDHEALWCRGRTDTKWQRIALPPGIGRNGKAIDALFVRGRELVAIDNVLLPKWILVYSLDSDWSDEPRKYPLATHTTYEHTLRAAEGDDYYAILSAGINHDIVSNYLAFICKTSLEEIGLWSGICADLDRGTDLDGLRSKSRGNEPMHRRLYSENDWKTGQILKAVKDIHVCDDSIF